MTLGLSNATYVCDKTSLPFTLLREGDPWKKLADAGGLTKATHRHPTDPERRSDIACGGTLRPRSA